MRSDLLLRLADHLLTGKLGHKRFNFLVFNAYDDLTAAGNKCGTIGCALGECPIIWPKHWKFTSMNVHSVGGVEYIHASSPDAFVGAEEFFGISAKQATGLFTPYAQHLIELPELPRSATKEQVGKLIKRFVAMNGGSHG